MNPSDISNWASVIMNGLFMFVAVYWPKIFSDGFWSRFVFTINFFAVIVNFGALVEKGVI